MKAKVILEINLPDIGATEKQVKDYIKYIFFYECYQSIDNSYLDDDVDDYRVTNIKIEL